MENEHTNYLDQRVDFVDRREQIALEKEIMDSGASDPIFNIEYKGGPQHIELENEDYKLTFDYEDTPDLGHSDLGDERPRHKLTSFILINKKTSKEINIFSLIQDVKIYFQPMKVEDGLLPNGVSNFENNDCWLYGDLSVPISIFTLLHELGHLTSARKAPQVEERLYVALKTLHLKYHKYDSMLEHIGNPELTDEDLAMILRSERDADAFAFRNFGPFRDNPTLMSGISAYSKVALNGYINAIHTVRKV